MNSTFHWKFMFYLLSVSSWFKAIKVDTGWLKPYFSLLSKKDRESEFTKSTHRIHRRLEDKDWERWNKGSFRGSRNSTWRKCFMSKRAWKGLCHCCCCRHNPDLPPSPLPPPSPTTRTQRPGLEDPFGPDSVICPFVWFSLRKGSLFP